MKVGDYVRTLKGITKIIDIRNEIIRNSANGNEVVIETNKIITDNGLIVSNDYKSSNKLIDLIEVGDYVNGYEVIKVYTKDFTEPIIQVSSKRTYCNGEIKSIVTKEQFSQMEYKIQ